MVTAGNPEHIPVIIGAGQFNDRPEDPDEGLDSLGLMIGALRSAEQDAGGDVLTELDSLAIVDQISFRNLGNLSAPLAEAIDATPKVTYQSDAPHGDTPIRLLNEAANRIGAGEVKLAAIVGGEALRTAAGRAKKRAEAATPGGRTQRPKSARRKPTYAQTFGLTAPVDVYPIYENAARAAFSQTLDAAQEESADIWSKMSEVAAETKGAWIRSPISPVEILTPGPANRPLAFPYTKLMVANSSVNQGAGFIVASLAEARRRNIPEERLVYVGMGAAAKEPSDLLQRDRFDRSVSMEVAIKKTLELNEKTGSDFDHVELYSCFPCIPKLARRVLDWPQDKPVTVFGGLTFGGGPIANYMSHAVAAMIEKLRSEGQCGFLFANGGFATDNHCIVLSTEPIKAARFPQSFDFQAEADAARGPNPKVDTDYIGPASIESFTVFHDRAGTPTSGVVVAKTSTGKRTLALIDTDYGALLSFFTDGATEPVGQTGRIELRADQRRYWMRN